MKVRELINLLNELPQDHDVQFLSADGYEDAVEAEFSVENGVVTFLPYTARAEIAKARKVLSSERTVEFNHEHPFTYPPKIN